MMVMLGPGIIVSRMMAMLGLGISLSDGKLGWDIGSMKAGTDTTTLTANGTAITTILPCYSSHSTQIVGEHFGSMTSDHSPSPNTTSEYTENMILF